MRHPSVLALLALLLESAPAVHAAERPWLEVRSPHFVVVSNDGDKAARRIAGQFEQIRSAFSAVLPNARLDPGRPIIVFAARDEDAFWELVPERAAAPRQRLGGLYFRGSEQDFILLRLDLRGDGSRAAVYHEYAHAILRLNFEWLPLWMNEGLAEFFAGVELSSERIVLGTRHQHHLDLLKVRSALPLETLLGVGHDSPHYNEGNTVSVFYAQSWLMVHYFLLHDQGRHWPELLGYVTGLTEGLEPREAARIAFGDPDAFAKRMAQYAHRDRFYSMKLRTRLERAASDFGARMLSHGEFAALRGTFHLQRGQLAAAREDLEQALALEPQLGGALAGMGVLEWREGNLDAARDWLGRALETPAADANVHLLHGRLMLGSGADAAASSAARSLRRAVEMAPNLARGHSELARAVLASGGELAEAVGHARNAIQLEPGEMEHRLTLAVVLANAGRHAEALLEAQTGLRAASSDAERTRIQSFLDSLGGQRHPATTKPFAPPEVGMASACAEGDARACLDLGRALAGRGERFEAAQFLLQACGAGDAVGCADLAALHCEDPGGLPLHNERGWGCFDLASSHLSGEGADRDAPRAARLFEQACSEGYRPGCTRLAMLLEGGEGVPADHGRAAQLFGTSCDAGESWACVKLGKLYEAGQGVPRDASTAVAQFARACEAADAWGCAHLGNAYERGFGVSKDPERAHALYAQSCAQGFAGACDLMRQLEARIPSVAH